VTSDDRSCIDTSFAAVALLRKKVSAECATTSQLTSTGNLDPFGGTLVGFHLWHLITPLFTSDYDAEVASSHLWLMLENCIVFKKESDPFDHLVT